MATKRSNKDGDKRRQEHGDKHGGEHGDKRVKVTAPHETVEGI
jgi:hypothetical protein